MDLLSYADYLADQAEIERAVRATPEISRFCSGPIWQRAAHDHLCDISEQANHIIAIDGDCCIAFVEREQPRIFYPFESSWMFGNPLLGPPEKALDLLEEVVRDTIDPPVGFCLGGVRKEGELHRLLQQRKSDWFQFEEFPGTDNMIIDLSDGVENWVGRRSKKFRKSLRQCRGLEGLEVVDAAAENTDDLFDRILTVQQGSYKWSDGTDIFQEPRYAAFYKQILCDLQKTGNLRILFARENGNDLAYIFGGIAGDTYRGFQMSYVDSVKKRAVGSALQIENIRRVASEGITTYDLGMHSNYKERWADRKDEYVAVFVVFG